MYIHRFFMGTGGYESLTVQELDEHAESYYIDRSNFKDRVCAGGQTRWGKMIVRGNSRLAVYNQHAWSSPEGSKPRIILSSGTSFDRETDPCKAQPLSITHYNTGSLNACLKKAHNGWDHSSQRKDDTCQHYHSVNEDGPTDDLVKIFADEAR